MEKIGQVILISAKEGRNTREICNQLAGTTIANPTGSGKVVHSYILEKYPNLGYDEVQVYSLADFMELNNNEEYYSQDWFVSYIYSV